jgi:phosphatidylethanolamine/phosphatidyl-N-methylethanolamine N-methyltransferase
LRPHHKRAESKGRSRTRIPSKSNPVQKGLAEQAHFIRALIDNPATTGAVSPSGRFLARCMARHVDPKEPGLVVELGPGTGPVTQALIDQGVAEERLMLVEFDADFCALLERRFPRAKVIRGNALHLSQTLAGKLDGPVAAIVSSVPLLNMPDAQRLALLEDAFRLMQGKGRFVQFTYGLVSPMPKKPKDARPVPFYAEASAPVWLNLPPARVWVYRPATEAPRAKRHPGQVLIAKIAGEIRQRKAQARTISR